MMDVLSRINEIFNNRKARKFFLKLRLPLGLVLFALLLPYTRREWFFPGLAVSVLGELLQVWCFATIRTHKKLTVTGPYMFVRNPMYLGRFFLIFGIIMMTGSGWLMAGFTALYYFYMTNRVRREERLLSELFGDDYRSYRERVPAYLPTFRQWQPDLLWSWNRESFFRNNAHTNLAAVALVYLILYYFTYPCPI